MRFVQACVLTLALLVTLGAAVASASANAGSPSDATPESLFQHVTDLAGARAAIPYEPPATVLPDALRGMTYDQYRSIRFRPEAALWRGQARFEAQFFHPGFLFPHPVTVYAVENGQVEELAFDPELFRFDVEAGELADAMTLDGRPITETWNHVWYADEL